MTVAFLWISVALWTFMSIHALHYVATCAPGRDKADPGDIFLTACACVMAALWSRP